MELLYGVGTFVLFLGLIWGAIAYKTRDKSKDAMTERATRRVINEGSEKGSDIPSPETQFEEGSTRN